MNQSNPLLLLVSRLAILFLTSALLFFSLFTTVSQTASEATLPPHTAANAALVRQEKARPLLVDTQSITVGNVLTATVNVTASQVLTEAESQVEGEANEEGSAPATSDAFSVPVLEGTIVANRTEAAVTLFIEGEMHRLEPLRSTGIILPRDSSAINLFNCDADSNAQSEEDCFWDPYLIQADGFYEILNGAAEGKPVKLILEEVGAPEENQIWVQNRTTETETFFLNDEKFELPPTAFLEFDLEEDLEPIFHLRSCISLDAESVCEWLPQPATVGSYYALNESRTSIGLPNSQIAFVELEPIIAQDEAAVEATQQNEETSTVADVVCRLNVPTLNIRSGPGLEYLVVSQAFRSEDGDATVRVVGQDALGLWLATDEKILDGGWISADSSLLTCEGDISSLPIAEITDGRLAPTPEVVEAADPGDATGSDDTGNEDIQEENGEDADPATPPKGQSLLIVENVFEADVRFTLAEEYDLQPGGKVNIVVPAGRVQFSVSSPWRGGLAGNAEFIIEPDQTKEMFLYFIPDPDNSGKWLMRYE